MKTITMYELLGMVKDGKAPKKIKVGNKIYNYETFNIGKGDNYFTAEWREVKGYRINNDGTYYYLEIRDYNLNDEVEILEEMCHKCHKYPVEYNQTYCEFCLGISKLEEKKIPGKLPYYSVEKIQEAKNKDEWLEERIKLLEKRVNDLHIKMNDLLDYLKSKGE